MHEPGPPFDPARRQWLKAGASLLAGLLLAGPAAVLGDPAIVGDGGAPGDTLLPAGNGLGPGAGGTAGQAARAGSSGLQVAGPPRTLSFFHTHTLERCSATYWRDGAYDPAALREIDVILRDYRTEEIRETDRDLIELLHQLQQNLRTGEPFHVICGYRSKETNDALRRKSRGVARRSLHLDARAVDLRVPGVRLGKLRDVATRLERGGVGYYPRSKFVHIDNGDPRTWRG